MERIFHAVDWTPPSGWRLPELLGVAAVDSVAPRLHFWPHALQWTRFDTWTPSSASAVLGVTQWTTGTAVLALGGVGSIETSLALADLLLHAGQGMGLKYIQGYLSQSAPETYVQTLKAAGFNVVARDVLSSHATPTVDLYEVAL